MQAFYSRNTANKAKTMSSDYGSKEMLIVTYAKTRLNICDILKYAINLSTFLYAIAKYSKDIIYLPSEMMTLKHFPQLKNIFLHF